MKEPLLKTKLPKTEYDKRKCRAPPLIAKTPQYKISLHNKTMFRLKLQIVKTIAPVETNTNLPTVVDL